MNHANEWMSGWAGSGMWVWTIVGLALVALVIVAIVRIAGK